MTSRPGWAEAPAQEGGSLRTPTWTLRCTERDAFIVNEGVLAGSSPGEAPHLLCLPTPPFRFLNLAVRAVMTPQSGLEPPN